MLRYFGNSCFIAEDSVTIVGVVMGFFSQQHESTYFLWQIGVSPARQGQGIGKKLLKYVEQELGSAGIKRIEVTIDPENIPSKKAFDRSGYINISEQIGKTVIVNGNTAVKDHYSPDRHFMVYEKKL
jgi:ribosomal protein S18 acetylase RimI-like enzyme